MKQRVVVVAGVSGVGKSFLLTRLRATQAFQHLQASEVIAAERRLQTRENFGELLRNGNIGDNQTNLISGFGRQRSVDAPCVVLDGHVVIDTDGGYVAIEPHVFEDIGVTRLVLLVDNPVAIASRRVADTHRHRPVRTPQQIADYQAASVAQGLRIALALLVPLVVLPVTQADGQLVF